MKAVPCLRILGRREWWIDLSVMIKRENIVIGKRGICLDLLSELLPLKILWVVLFCFFFLLHSRFSILSLSLSLSRLQLHYRRRRRRGPFIRLDHLIWVARAWLQFNLVKRPMMLVFWSSNYFSFWKFKNMIEINKIYFLNN